MALALSASGCEKTLAFRAHWWDTLGGTLTAHALTQDERHPEDIPTAKAPSTRSSCSPGGDTLSPITTPRIAGEFHQPWRPPGFALRPYRQRTRKWRHHSLDCSNMIPQPCRTGKKETCFNFKAKTHVE